MATKGLLTSKGGGAVCVFRLKQGKRQSQNVSAVNGELPTAREISVGPVPNNKNMVTPRKDDLRSLGPAGEFAGAGLRGRSDQSIHCRRCPMVAIAHALLMLI